MIRFKERFVQQTIVEHLRTGLGELGWLEAPAPLGAEVVHLVEDWDPELLTDERRNMVAVNYESDLGDKVAELGGGLRRLTMDFAIDVVCENRSIATSVASDVRMLLDDAVLGLLDFTLDEPVALEGAVIELEDVQISRTLATVQGVDLRARWRVVDLWAVLHYNPAPAEVGG